MMSVRLDDQQIAISALQLQPRLYRGPVLIVVGIKKEKEKNSQKGKKRRGRKGFPEIYDVVL